MKVYMNNIDKNKIGEVVFNRATISLPTQNTIFEKNSNFVIHKRNNLLVCGLISILREGMFSIFNFTKVINLCPDFSTSCL